MFDQGRGFERGEGREFVIPLIAFFNIHIIDIFTTYWLCAFNEYNTGCKHSLNRKNDL